MQICSQFVTPYEFFDKWYRWTEFRVSVKGYTSTFIPSSVCRLHQSGGLLPIYDIPWYLSDFFSIPLSLIRCFSQWAHFQLMTFLLGFLYYVLFNFWVGCIKQGFTSNWWFSLFLLVLFTISFSIIEKPASSKDFTSNLWPSFIYVCSLQQSGGLLPVYLMFVSILQHSIAIHWMFQSGCSLPIYDLP